MCGPGNTFDRSRHFYRNFIPYVPSSCCPGPGPRGSRYGLPQRAHSTKDSPSLVGALVHECRPNQQRSGFIRVPPQRSVGLALSTVIIPDARPLICARHGPKVLSRRIHVPRRRRRRADTGHSLLCVGLRPLRPERGSSLRAGAGCRATRLIHAVELAIAAVYHASAWVLAMPPRCSGHRLGTFGPVSKRGPGPR